jgi:hypothetical protein
MEPTKEQLSIFDGLMLSDASLTICRGNQNSRMSMTSKHRNFIEAMISNLSFLSWGPINDKYIYDKRTKKSYHSVRVHSHVSEWLTEQRHRWYPNGKKIVPKDVIVNKECLEWWYLGDGHLERKKNRPNARRVQLAVNGFTNSDNEILKNKLVDLLGNDAVYIECKNSIIISKLSLVKMATMLTDSPVEVYKYKYEFGQYRNSEYFANSYNGRPLEKINKYRKIHKVRELDFEEVKLEIK